MDGRQDRTANARTTPVTFGASPSQLSLSQFDDETLTAQWLL